MLRQIASVPALPLRLLDEIVEIRELVRELLDTEERLTRTSESMDRKISALDVANERLGEALEELRGFNAKLDRLDSRVERLERDMGAVRDATDEIKELVPDVGRGPLAKAKDALTSE